VYWNSFMHIGTANMDGSVPPANYFMPIGAIPGWGEPSCGIAVNEGHLYWHGASQIGRVGLDGVPVAEPMVKGLGGQSCGLAIDGSHLYWTEPSSKSIGRANLDGAESKTDFISDLEKPCGVAVDGQYLYWSDLLGIGRARLDGSEVDREFIEAPGACGLAVDGQYIYWGGFSGSGIGRANIDGSDRNDQFIAGTGPVWGLARNSTHLFWGNQRYGEWGSGAIGRAGLDGSNVEHAWIPGLYTSEIALAVDSRPEPPPLSLRTPSRSFKFGKLTRNRQTGVAYLDVIVPNRGELVVVEPRIGWKVLRGNPPSWLGGVFTWHLKVWPGKRGPVSKRIQRQLKLKGRAPVNLHLAYSEENKGPVLAQKRIVLARHLPVKKAHTGR